MSLDEQVDRHLAPRRRKSAQSRPRTVAPTGQVPGSAPTDHHPRARPKDVSDQSHPRLRGDEVHRCGAVSLRVRAVAHTSRDPPATCAIRGGMREGHPTASPNLANERGDPYPRAGSRWHRQMFFYRATQPG